MIDRIDNDIRGVQNSYIKAVLLQQQHDEIETQQFQEHWKADDIICQVHAVALGLDEERDQGAA